jgi:hypothetical protein
MSDLELFMKKKIHHQGTKAPRKAKTTFFVVHGVLVPWWCSFVFLMSHSHGPV